MKRAVLAAALLVSVPATAGWKVAAPGVAIGVAHDGMMVTPPSAWNRWTVRPSKRGETWTQDGVALNELQFFAGVLPGEAVWRERRKKDEPLPKFRAGMLAPEIVGIVEGSHRILLGTALFEVEAVEPATFLGAKGVRFAYRYTVPDEEVRRRGEGRATVIGGKLYLITFAAPAIHYFDAGIGEARAIMDGARLAAAPQPSK
jgi:hypothetical protein